MRSSAHAPRRGRGGRGTAQAQKSRGRAGLERPLLAAERWCRCTGTRPRPPRSASPVPPAAPPSTVRALTRREARLGSSPGVGGPAASARVARRWLRPGGSTGTAGLTTEQPPLLPGRCSRHSPGPAALGAAGRAPRALPSPQRAAAGPERRLAERPAPQAADWLPQDITQSAAPPDWLNSISLCIMGVVVCFRLSACYPVGLSTTFPVSPRAAGGHIRVLQEPGGESPNQLAAGPCGGR